MLEGGHPVAGQWPSSCWIVAIQFLDSGHPVPGQWPSTTWIHTLRIFTSLLYISDCIGSDHVMLEGGHPVAGQWPSSCWIVAIQFLDSGHLIPGEFPSTTWIHALRIFTSLLYISDYMCSDHVILEGGHPVAGQWPSSCWIVPSTTWIHALGIFTSLLYTSDCMCSDHVMLEDGRLVGGQWPSSSWTVAIQLLDSGHSVPGYTLLGVFASLLYISDCMGSDHVRLEGGHPVPVQWPSTTWIHFIGCFLPVCCTYLTCIEYLYKPALHV